MKARFDTKEVYKVFNSGCYHDWLQQDMYQRKGLKKWKIGIFWLSIWLECCMKTIMTIN